MKDIILFLLLAVHSLCLFAQSVVSFKVNASDKPPIDTSAYSKWLSVKDAAISNDGKYALYKIVHSYTSMPPLLIAKAIGGTWQMKVSGVKEAKFTQDSRKLICLRSNDSLCIYTLGDTIQKVITGVKSFQLFSNQNIDWLVYRLYGLEKDIVIQSLANEKGRSFSGVDTYLISKDGKSVILSEKVKNGNRETRSLNWLVVDDSINKVLWSSTKEGIQADNLVLNDAGTQLGFRIQADTDANYEKSFWYYKEGMDDARLLVDDKSATIGNNLELDNISKFTIDGDGLFIYLKPKNMAFVRPSIAKVDVWSYQDALLQPQQLSNLGNPKTYKAIVNIKTSEVRQLQLDGEKALNISNFVSDDFVFNDDCKGDLEEVHWSLGSQPSSFEVSTKNGARKHINLFLSDMSPAGNYVIGLDHNLDLCSYELATGKTMNISHRIPVPLYTDKIHQHATKGIRVMGWMLSNPNELLIYDRFDIWRVDLAALKDPINVTNGYGRKHNIEFRLANSGSLYYQQGKVFIRGKAILLRGFDFTNKSGGYFRLILGNNGCDPIQLTMGPYDYSPDYDPATLIKAENAEVFLLKRACATQSPNYFWTTNFKKILPLSFISPERGYNWLRTELVFFKSLDGQRSQGILFKPENYNPKTRYPVIINYYEQESDNVNEYQGLNDEDGQNIAIPWLVSHGYVVFIADIHYKRGENGKNALDAILGAKAYLEGLPWVDGKHIGLYGHSFGGFETNYIVTHTDSFAAAVSSSGMSDAVSDYGSLWSGLFSKENYWEYRQGRMNATLWERPDLYIKNSPIFHVNRITIPLLMVANIGDGNVAFAQGLELFLAMRRLGKKGWMLQYDGGGHGMLGQPFIDFTIRAQQFFDFYLKNAPAPKWMIEGLPANMKGIDDGLELEAPGVMPGKGLVRAAGNR